MNKNKHPLETIVADGQCMGCGFCAASFASDNPEIQVEMVQDKSRGYDVPSVTGWQQGMDEGSFVCPGHEMDMPALSTQVFGSQPDNGVTGHVKAARAVYATDDKIRRKAASGGAIPAILAYLFEQNLIDRAYVLVTPPGQLEGVGRTIHSMAEFEACHGSHYHPPRFGAGLSDFLTARGRFAFVGVPCQIAGLQMAMAQDEALTQECVAAISLFCGGLNSFEGIGYYLKGYGVKTDEVATIGYRVGNWPGAIALERKDGSNLIINRIHGAQRWQIMHYMAAFQGYWMLKRCRICPDQIGDFADIAVGDPHSRRFRALSKEHDGKGFSAMLTRTEHGESLIQDVIKQGYLNEIEMSTEEVIKSQGYTLEQRRQAEVYASIDKWLGGTPPLIKSYEGLSRHKSFRHKMIAFIDLAKLRLNLKKPWRPLIWLWQTFEYVFLRFSPKQVGKRILNIVMNR